MKRILITLGFIALIILPSKIPVYSATYKAEEHEQKIINNELTLKNKYIQMVSKYAEKYNVSRETMIDVINCENIEWNATLQSRLRYKRNHEKWGVLAGQREQSFGLAQIHLPSHPSITYEQAIDPEFSIEFLAKNLSKGKGKLWSCYRKLY